HPRDDQKRQVCQSARLTLIEIPYWWDNQKASLLATIHKFRPDLVSAASLPPDALPVTLDPPDPDKHKTTYPHLYPSLSPIFTYLVFSFFLFFFVLYELVCARSWWGASGTGGAMWSGGGCRKSSTACASCGTAPDFSPDQVKYHAFL